MKSKGTSFSKSVDRSYKNKVRLLICQAYSHFCYLSKCSPAQVIYNLACVTDISIWKLSDYYAGDKIPPTDEFLKILDACRVRINVSCPEPKEPLNYVPSSLIPTI